MARAGDLDRLIERIYDTVDDLTAWDDVVSQICTRISGTNGVMAAFPKLQGPVPVAAHYRLDPALTPRIGDQHINNPWAQKIVTQPIGVPIASDALVTVRDLRRSAFYCDILEPQRIGHGAFFRIEDMSRVHVGLSIHRSIEKGPFSTAELAASEPFLPHLRRAVQLRLLLERTELQRQLVLETLEGLASGLVIVSAAGRALFANRTARELAATREAIVLDARGIRVRHRLENRAFQRLIGSAVVGGAGGALALSRASGRLSLVVLVAPLVGTLAATATTAGLSSGAAAVFLTDPERQAEPPAERLQALYGLTPTEARVALHLVRAGTIARAAVALGLAPETIRTHLKRIYAKTGVHQQGALARLLSAAAVLHPR